MRGRRCATALLGLMALGGRLSAQDTTQAYPWRLSYFPYPTVSPNDGLMAMARVVWFRQSRWDDRVSVRDQIAVEGGYSTRDSWLVRIRGDFPRIGPGWRVRAFAEAGRYTDYLPGDLLGGAAARQIVGAEITRALTSRVYLALRGEAMHVSIPLDTTALAIYATPPSPATETDVRGRLAVVYDRRDREYDTRSGALLQAGVMLGSAGTGYRGGYALASIWVPLTSATRVTARLGTRLMSRSTIDATRIIPAWEDEFVVVGGPQSNRALPAGTRGDRDVELASVEIRHDLITFPGGAVAVLAFVDGGRGYCACAPPPPGSVAASGDWVLGPGGGVALRLLRNAVLTATVARADGATRIYLGSGWSW